MLKYFEKQGFFGYGLNIADRRYPANLNHFWVTDWVTAKIFGIRSFVTQMPLSDLKIRKAKQKDKPYRMSDGLGLSLQERPTGSKLWHFRYQYMGREKTLSIGQYPIISLAEARAKRDDAKRLLAEGRDPSVQKKLDSIDAHVKARMTFKEVADEYYETLVDRDLADATLRKKRWQIDDRPSRSITGQLIRSRLLNCCIF